jgi:hypothetical protein
VISNSFVIALIALGLLLSLCVAAYIGGSRLSRNDEWGGEGVAVRVTAVVLAVIFLGSFGAGLYPYDMQYHRYKHVEGTVSSIEARMLADGDGTTQNYAVRFETDDTYRCDDSRCSLVKPGDQLSLWCIREWQYASTSGWGCRFDKSRRAGAQ